MNTLTIHTVTGSVSVKLKYNSELSSKLNGEDIVKVYFSSPSSIDVRIGDYTNVFGKRYTINTAPVIRKLSSNLYEYEIVFEGAIYNLSKVSFLDTDATGIHMAHEFYINANIDVFASVIQNNLDRVYGSGTWTVLAQGLRTDIVKNLSFSEVNCLNALKTICSEFDCEFEINSNVTQHSLTLRQQVGGGMAVNFQYGKGNGLYSLSRNIASANNLTTRLYAFGSSKNIGANYRNYSTRLKLPGIVSGTPDIEVNVDEIELFESYWRVYGQTDALNVSLQLKVDGNTNWINYGESMSGAGFNAGYLSYPAIIVATHVRVRAWSVLGKYVYSDGTSSGWDIQVHGDSYIDNPTAIAKYGVIERTIIFDEIFPEREGVVTSLGDNIYEFIDSAMFDLNELDENGDSKYMTGPDAKVSFRTGNLAGYEFVIGAYDTVSKKFSLNKYTDERTMEFPNPDSSAFQISVGDKYVILDITMPQSYIEEAEQRLLTEAESWLNKYSNEQVVYELDVDELYVKENELSFSIGNSIGVTDTELGVNDQIRIVELRRNLVLEHSYTLKLSDSIYISKTRQSQPGKIVSTVQMKSSGIQSDWDEENHLEPSYIKNKPDLNDFADKHLSFNINHKLTETIQHDLGKKPSVSVLDDEGNLCIADVAYLDENSVTVNFINYFTGKIVFN